MKDGRELLASRAIPRMAAVGVSIRVAKLARNPQLLFGGGNFLVVEASDS